MPLIPCPTCRKIFDTATSPAMPFCSQRCKQIDLGRWLGEGYSVPIKRPNDDDEGDREAGPIREDED